MTSLANRARWYAEEAVDRVRSRVPQISISSGSGGSLMRLAIAFVLGAGLSWWYAEGLVHERIMRQLSESSAAVREAVAAANAEAATIEAAAIDAVQDLERRTQDAEMALAAARAASEQCIVPIDCLRKDDRDAGRDVR